MTGYFYSFSCPIIILSILSNIVSCFISCLSCKARLIFFVVLFIGGIAYAKDISHKKTSVAQEEMEMRVYEVLGMNCPGCHGGVEKLVKKIEAINSVEANWKEKVLTVTVKSGETLNDEDVYDAIRRANFTPGKRLQ